MMLKEGKFDFSSESKKVDVYSFAIVLYEVMFEAGFLRHLKILELQEHILSGKRVEIDSKELNELKTDSELRSRQVVDLLEIITICWSQNPKNRPEFSELLERISKMEVK